jgi:glycyl-tRNA synthetase
LMEKDEKMSELAKELTQKLKKTRNIEYDAWWNIWKRYRRQDEIWTPYCATIDHQTLEDWTITIRERDTMNQIRIESKDLYEFLANK